jgi:hypothetical protein
MKARQRTTAYAFTAYPTSSVDMEKISLLRKVVSNMNKEERLRLKGNPNAQLRLKRVCLKARLGVGNPAAIKYRHQYIKSIRLEDAERVDVYIQNRSQYE